MWTKKQLTNFKKILTAEKDRIETTLAANKRGLQESNDRVSDEIDEATNLAQAALELRIKERETRLLQKILGALRRIDLGIFGVCGVCEAQIEERRMTARPVTTSCVTCKERQEKVERVYGNT